MISELYIIYVNKKIKHYQLKIANRITQKHWNKHIPGLSYSYIELYIHLTELNAKLHNNLTIQEINNIKKYSKSIYRILSIY